MRKTIKRANSILLLFFGIIFAVLTILGVAVWTLTFHPADIQPAPVSCMDKTGVPKGGETIKVLSWNVQYMAGKGHCFFYEGGTDKAPTETEVIQTLNHAARVIKIENPDMILLQEIDEGAKRSHYMDQLKMLCERLDGMYPCRSEAFYWKAGFVPHPDIMGAVGMKLVILSKYRISAAKRYQLPLIPENWLFQQFNLKRALLEVRIPFGEHELIIMNTHLSAFAQGTDTMEKQIAAVKSIIKKHSGKNRPWIAGGDFNLLPPGNAYQALPPKQRSAYRRKTEIKPLFEAFHAIPGKEDVDGNSREKWFTHFPNRPDIKAPNRTIDYIFYSDRVKRKSAHVRRSDTLDISDHLPVVAEFTLPAISGGRK
ncbi:MAG: endonuclease/exonuclease/phosphatase family protein [Desulfobacterales bacterium]|nr:endonuclease/exonuclease/phosphatase family protein [Desulfobacterales bacterium]